MLSHDFVTGCQWYLDALPGSSETTPRIVVTAIVEDIEIMALVDTGATSCVLSWENAAQLADHLLEGNPQVRALGGSVHEGVLFPVALTFRADEGVRVDLQTSAWSAETFHGPNLIGYGGLLEKMRFCDRPGFKPVLLWELTSTLATMKSAMWEWCSPFDEGGSVDVVS